MVVCYLYPSYLVLASLCSCSSKSIPLHPQGLHREWCSIVRATATATAGHEQVDGQSQLQHPLDMQTGAACGHQYFTTRFSSAISLNRAPEQSVKRVLTAPQVLPLVAPHLNLARALVSPAGLLTTAGQEGLTFDFRCNSLRRHHHSLPQKINLPHLIRQDSQIRTEPSVTSTASGVTFLHHQAQLNIDRNRKTTKNWECTCHESFNERIPTLQLSFGN